MHLFTTPSNIIITCSKHLSPYLKQEVEALGFKPERVFQTGIELNGTMNDCIHLNLNLRCASQILFSIKKFKAFDADDLYNNLSRISWEKIITPNTYFSITGKIDNNTINNPLFANVKVKDAIADRLRNKTGNRPNSGPELNGAVIHLFWKEYEAEIFIDTSGETLSKHGYRKMPSKAPMMESLAAATILATQWNRNSNFINPMCGAGTLAIEAALLATNRMPGLQRSNYAFMHIVDYDESVYFNEMTLLKNKITSAPTFKIIATDLDEEAVKAAKYNAYNAGVEMLIDFDVCDFANTIIPESEKGIVIMNPEYGERLGEATALEGTYSRIGDFLKQKCGGYMGYIFTGNMNLAKKIGLKANKKYEFYNSTIECRLLEYELYEGSKREPKKEKE